MLEQRFDPDAGTPDEQRAAARGRIGWKGVFPTTPCAYCGHEFFRWYGDWGLGYHCAACRKVWQLS